MESLSIEFPDAQYKPGVQCKDKNGCSRSQNQSSCLRDIEAEETLGDYCMQKIPINLNIHQFIYTEHGSDR